jgi:hypothetical protein
VRQTAGKAARKNLCCSASLHSSFAIIGEGEKERAFCNPF